MDAPADLGCRLFEDVTIQPIRRRGRGEKPGFGVHDRNGKFLSDFFHPLTDRWCTVNAPTQPSLRIEERCLYGGTIIGHYGHFILETLARCWAFDGFPRNQIVWTKLQIGNSHERWSAWIPRLFSLLGIDQHRIHVIDGTTALREVILPDPGFNYFRSLHPSQAERLKIIGYVGSVPTGKIWLSRSALPEGFSRIIGEDCLETRLRDEGWSIVAPEKLSIEEQAGLFHSAEVVAGFSTSAFHNVLLQKTPRSRLRIFIRDTIPTKNYEIIAERLAIEQKFLTADICQVSERSARSSYALVDPLGAYQTLMASL
jgi:capsular polysaccharide biosynthesis protein